MRSSRVLFLTSAILISSICHGQAKCPWMNKATAQGILGGAVTAKTNVTNHEGDCDFVRRQDSVVYELHIAVHIMADVAKQFPAYLARCGPKPIPLPTIGNQAVGCDIIRKKHFTARVVGRVRNQAFIVSVGSSVRNSSQSDRSMTEETRREKVALAAEQVAGILF